MTNDGSLAAQNIRVGPVSFQKKSANRKLSPVRYEKTNTRFQRPHPVKPFCCSTYVSIAKTCPDFCRFKDHGCYAQEGITRQFNMLLDRDSEGMEPDEVMELEASVIDYCWGKGVPQDGARGGRDLRLHSGGEVSSARGARILAKAIDRWKSRGGGNVWTYTHRWKRIPRDAWGGINVMASVETSVDADDAYRNGYTPLLTVVSFRRKKSYDLHRSKYGLKLIPCRSQTKGVTCVQCRLCIESISKPIVVGVEIHGRSFHIASNRVIEANQMKLRF